MRVYFDSSAFAKRYIDETGTETVLAWCERASELALSVIAVPELISAFCRLQREGRLTDAQYQIIKRALMLDIADHAPGPPARRQRLGKPHAARHGRHPSGRRPRLHRRSVHLGRCAPMSRRRGLRSASGIFVKEAASLILREAMQ